MLKKMFNMFHKATASRTHTGKSGCKKHKIGCGQCFTQFQCNKDYCIRTSSTQPQDHCILEEFRGAHRAVVISYKPTIEYSVTMTTEIPHQLKMKHTIPVSIYQ